MKLHFKFILHPENILAKDGDTHFISSGQLIVLYGLKAKYCKPYYGNGLYQNTRSD